MKLTLPKFVFAVALGIAASGAVYAHEDATEAGANHWISHLGENPSAPTTNELARYGYPAARNADREVTLTSGDKYLNVTRLETVQINIAGKSVLWTFDTLGTDSFPLSKVISGADGITVYVKGNPFYDSP